jgi:hypothetical protein
MKCKYSTNILKFLKFIFMKSKEKLMKKFNFADIS